MTGDTVPGRRPLTVVLEAPVSTNPGLDRVPGTLATVPASTAIFRRRPFSPGLAAPRRQLHLQPCLRARLASGPARVACCRGKNGFQGSKVS